MKETALTGRLMPLFEPGKKPEAMAWMSNAAIATAAAQQHLMPSLKALCKDFWTKVLVPSRFLTLKLALLDRVSGVLRYL